LKVFGQVLPPLYGTARLHHHHGQVCSEFPDAKDNAAGKSVDEKRAALTNQGTNPYHEE
jgi:hypothetical protein